MITGMNPGLIRWAQDTLKSEFAKGLPLLRSIDKEWAAAIEAFPAPEQAIFATAAPLRWHGQNVDAATSALIDQFRGQFQSALARQTLAPPTGIPSTLVSEIAIPILETALGSRSTSRSKQVARWRQKIGNEELVTVVEFGSGPLFSIRYSHDIPRFRGYHGYGSFSVMPAWGLSGETTWICNDADDCERKVLHLTEAISLFLNARPWEAG